MDLHHKLVFKGFYGLPIKKIEVGYKFIGAMTYKNEFYYINIFT